ncbi:hypothetical protein Trydic_g8155 [Trypoxylus dichotomus]
MCECIRPWLVLGSRILVKYYKISTLLRTREPKSSQQQWESAVLLLLLFYATEESSLEVTSVARNYTIAES